MPLGNETNGLFFLFHERHGFAFARGMGVPLENGKKDVFSFRERHGFDFTRGINLLSQEVQSCVIRKGKKCMLPGFLFSLFL